MTSTGPAGTLAFHTTNTAGDCLGCASTNSINVCINIQNPFETVSVVAFDIKELDPGVIGKDPLSCDTLFGSSSLIGGVFGFSPPKKDMEDGNAGNDGKQIGSSISKIVITTRFHEGTNQP